MKADRNSRVLCAVMLLGGGALGQTTERVSVSSSGTQGNKASSYPAISWDGLHVAFESDASNLVLGDAWGFKDAFVHDRLTGNTKLVSKDSSGNQGYGASTTVSVSEDGNYVAFVSYASNLVPDDTNGVSDIFVRDRQASTTERVSVDSSGNEGNGHSQDPSISGDGRYVAFSSYATNLVPGDSNGVQIYVHDRQTGATEQVSVDASGNAGNDDSNGPSISGDGRYVAFYSDATDLVPGDTNGRSDVFVHDRQTGTTERVSVDSSGNQGSSHSLSPSISVDGRYVAFHSKASNLVPGDTNGDHRRLRPRSPDGCDGAGQRRFLREPGQQHLLVCLHLRGRPQRGVRKLGQQSGPGRHEPGPRCFRPRPPDGRDGASQRRFLRKPGQLRLRGPLDLCGRPLFGVPQQRQQPGPGRHERRDDVFVRDRGIQPEVYCTAGTSASGCQASISAAGTASASAASGFALGSTGVEGGKDGLFFFGTNGQQANPWGNGTSYQCVVPPVVRAGTLAGSGTIGLCDGSFSQDLNALWCPTCPKPQKNPGAGAIVQAQLWYRDPLSTSNQTTSLSDAIEFVTAP